MKKFMIDTPISVHDVTLIPVVCERLQSHYNAMTYWLAGNKEPLAIIVCDSNGTRAFDMSSNEISITFLSKKIPNLNTLLISHRHHQNH